MGHDTDVARQFTAELPQGRHDARHAFPGHRIDGGEAGLSVVLLQITLHAEVGLVLREFAADGHAVDMNQLNAEEIGDAAECGDAFFGRERVGLALHEGDPPVSVPVEVVAAENRAVAVGRSDVADCEAAGVDVQQHGRNRQGAEPHHVPERHGRARHLDDGGVVPGGVDRRNRVAVRRQHDFAQLPVFVCFRVAAGAHAPFLGQFARPVRHGQQHFARIRAAGHAAEDSDLRHPVDQPVRFEAFKHFVEHAAVAFELVHQLPDRIKFGSGRKVVEFPVQRPVKLFHLRFEFHSDVSPFGVTIIFYRICTVCTIAVCNFFAQFVRSGRTPRAAEAGRRPETGRIPGFFRDRVDFRLPAE